MYYNLIDWLKKKYVVENIKFLAKTLNLELEQVKSLKIHKIPVKKVLKGD